MNALGASDYTGQVGSGFMMTVSRRAPTTPVNADPR
jgi:hypothetical protein